MAARAALLTGRYAIRTGPTQGAGITVWEVTIAEALQSIGYATSLFGKRHLGGDRPENRNPSQQGFDEFNLLSDPKEETDIKDANPSTLIIEVTRGGVLGGPASTTRSVYRKG